MVNLYWRSDKWSCRSENYISLVGPRKYFTLFSWHRPRFALSIRSIRSIRRMVNLYWRSVKWSCRSENCISLEGLRKYFTSSRGIDPVSLCRFDRFVRFVEWWSFIHDPSSGVVDRKIASHVLMFSFTGVSYVMYPFTRLLLYRCKSQYNLSFIYTTFGVLERGIFMCLWPLSPLLPEYVVAFCRLSAIEASIRVLLICGGEEFFCAKVRSSTLAPFKTSHTLSLCFSHRAFVIAV